MVLTPVFHLHGECAELLAADVLQRVRRQRCAPGGCAQDRRRFRRPGIGEHIPIGISADEVAGRKDVEDAAPPVGVHRHRGTRWNTSIENSDPIVLEQDRVEPWRSDHGVEVIGPRPRGGRAGAGQRDEAFRTVISSFDAYSQGLPPASLTFSVRALGPEGFDAATGHLRILVRPVRDLWSIRQRTALFCLFWRGDASL